MSQSIYLHTKPSELFWGIFNCYFGFYAILRYVHLVMIAYNIGKILLLDAVDLKWLKIDEGTDKGWISSLSFNWLKYGLRKYALEKIVLSDSAEYRDSLKKSGVTEALLDFAA